MAEPISNSSLRMELEAERQAHRKDNEYLLAERDRYRAALERIDAEGRYPGSPGVDDYKLVVSIAREALHG